MDLPSSGAEAKIIFEGASVQLVPLFEKKMNPFYQKAKDLGIIAGVCLACSKVLDVYDQNKNSGLALLEDMSGHAGMKGYINEGYQIISM